MYNFSVFTELYSCDHNLIFKHFPFPKKKTCACSTVASCFPCPPLATTNLWCTIKNITITQHCKAIKYNYIFLMQKKVTLLSGKLLKNCSFQFDICMYVAVFFICFNQTVYQSKLTQKHICKSGCFFLLEPDAKDICTI